MIQTPVKQKPQTITKTRKPTLPAASALVDQPQPANPFTLYQKNPTTVTPQAVSWLWQQRIPATGITILDGDHGLGKSLLALQLAAHVSSGTPMPDGTPTIQGGVIIITPHAPGSTTQLQHLISLGANLEHIRFLSYVHDPNPQPQTDSFPSTSGYRPFSLPEDLPRLLEAIEQVNARLIILDPFIYLLSQQQRHTSLRLSHLLTNINQILAERNIACLLLRNCRAKGGQAQPSTLEKSDHFSTIAVSHLLLAPNPIQPPYILLSHALNRHGSLAHTLILQIQPLPTNPDLAHIIVHGPHTLTAAHFLTQRPTTLHRQLLSQFIPIVLTQSAEPTPATTLYTFFPYSSISQIQRALKDLLLTGQIQRPARGLYSPKDPNSKLIATAATTPSPKLTATGETTPVKKLSATATTTRSKLNHSGETTPKSKLVTPAATTSSKKLIASGETTPPTKLNHSGATTSIPKLVATGETTTSHPKLVASGETTSSKKLVASGETTPPTKLNHSDETTKSAKLVASGETTPPATPKKPVTPAATTSNPKPSRPHKHANKQHKSHGRPR